MFSVQMLVYDLNKTNLKNFDSSDTYTTHMGDGRGRGGEGTPIHGTADIDHNAIFRSIFRCPPL